MKQFNSNVFIFSAAALIFAAAQPASAQTTEITQVQLNPIDGGISVVLKTSSGSRSQVFTTKKGKALVADMTNTQLRLPQGKNFRQDNPAPGIISIEVNQLDTNSVRVIVTGSDNSPTSTPAVRKEDSITLSFTPATQTTASTPTEETTASKVAATPVEPGKKPDVLVPNPQVLIDGKPAKPAGIGQPLNQAPPFLPRAVAPPVGDIAVSNIDTSPSSIDLGTQERVPRLVLRDAPVREVLSLLARAAGLNLAYIGGEGDKPAEGQTGAAVSQTISLDIENEPVQDVFNYVLRLSGLEANRSGRTIFVGAKLPNSTRDIVMRNMRLNQVTVGVALNFLVALGAESAVSRERQVTSVSAIPVGGASNAAVTQTLNTVETRIETQRVTYQDSTPLLRGLQASADERTNSVSLIGPSKLIDIAVAQLTQLDIRRRQVAINVKIIDVNLSGIQDTNTSFSFGVGDNYLSVDGGAATYNFGGLTPPTSTQARNSLVAPTVISNPYADATTFLDPGLSTPVIPDTGVDTRNITVNNSGSGSGSITETQGGDLSFLQPRAGISGDPFNAGITEVTPGTPNVITSTTNPGTTSQVTNADGSVTTVTTPPTTTVSVTPGTRGSVTAGLPTLFQYPTKFLATLQATVQSGNAKILTDPTVTVQEGQDATLKLTSEVYGGIEQIVVNGNLTRRPIIREAGLTLAMRVDRIDDNGFVSLSVAPTVSAPANEAASPDGTISLLAARSVNSGVLRLRDGQTLIMAGIIQDQDRATVSKLPILGDIPLLGSLFRRTNRSNERREVIVLLTPQVMDDSDRSAYGYNYTPSPQVREVLERRGLKTPGRQ
ncbi:AMIN domain-containing protein [Cronbergia sp. UHCC 0137]|uniref:AMIN domain-containing protein n=1 Tax=Cronbergia sp. UHCC 0137 TaxID=3110239 RepID=UPI002B1EFD0E|nr:AMIN domain-containing protein [Cronbergia sp. UHCC 0137]MEA5618913.1 AMIN domain-containing protein [Cronbergia sp. UHCC 0137]